MFINSGISCKTGDWVVTLLRCPFTLIDLFVILLRCPFRYIVLPTNISEWMCVERLVIGGFRALSMTISEWIWVER